MSRCLFCVEKDSQQSGQAPGGGAVSLRFSQAALSGPERISGPAEHRWGAAALLVDRLVVEGFALRDRQRARLTVEFLEEATPVAGVAGPAGLPDLKEEDIAVAIDKPAHDLLGVAAGFAFEPEFFPGPAPVVHETGFEGFLQGFAVHPGKHQDASAGGAGIRSLLDDGGDEIVGSEFEVEFHSCRSADSGIIRNLA